MISSAFFYIPDSRFQIPASLPPALRKLLAILDNRYSPALCSANRAPILSECFRNLSVQCSTHVFCEACQHWISCGGSQVGIYPFPDAFPPLTISSSPWNSGAFPTISRPLAHRPHFSFSFTNPISSNLPLPPRPAQLPQSPRHRTPAFPGDSSHSPRCWTTTC